MDQSAKQQIIERLKQANNVLVTVSTNPSVDQLAACIGFTLLLNKMGKHGTAVFSGGIPSTIEFLKPEETIEKNTDSLRDFIIALDKSKADKLRYKVEDKIVKIFITPYRTSLSQDDLVFSQGDFNVDVVVGLGVHERQDLDQAIVNHGRILHDATVISINNHDQGSIGAINWVDLNASSLSEMLVDLGKGLVQDKMDAQMATAFMTGIVAETDRFSNDKTSPRTMSLSAELMSAGANQQLIAAKLEPEVTIPQDSKPAPTSDEPPKEAVANDDGSLTITHNEPAESAPVATEESTKEPEPKQPEVAPAEEPADFKLPEPTAPKVEKAKSAEKEDKGPQLENPSSMVLEPPTMGGRLTANSEPEHLQLDPSTDPLSARPREERRILTRGTPAKREEAPTKTLSAIEESVGSPHIKTVLPTPPEPATVEPSPPVPVAPSVEATSDESLHDLPGLNLPEASAPSTDTIEPKDEEKVAETAGAETLDDARDAVEAAIQSGGAPSLEPIAALGAQPVNLDLGHEEPAQPAASKPNPVEQFTPAQPDTNGLSAPGVTPIDAPPKAGPMSMPNVPTMPLPGSPAPQQGINPNPSLPANLVPTTPPKDESGRDGPASPPPPVPPPVMPPAF